MKFIETVYTNFGMIVAGFITLALLVSQFMKLMNSLKFEIFEYKDILRRVGIIMLITYVLSYIMGSAIFIELTLMLLYVTFSSNLWDRKDFYKSERKKLEESLKSSKEENEKQLNENCYLEAERNELLAKLARKKKREANK